MPLPTIEPTQEQVAELLATMNTLYHEGQMDLPEWVKNFVLQSCALTAARMIKGQMSPGVAFISIAKLVWTLNTEARNRHWTV